MLFELVKGVNMSMEPDWINVARVSDIDSAVPLLVSVNNRPIALYRIDDMVYATDDTCSHAEASLSEGTYDGYIVTCPRHGGQFDIRTGIAVKMPAVTPIDVFTVRLEGGMVFLNAHDV